jgi:c-di-GMP-binding flagellar brake protein YcgR
MEQDTISNTRSSYRVKMPVKLARVQSLPDNDGEHTKERFRWAKERWVDVNVSMGGISFPSKWRCDCGDLIEIEIKTSEGQIITASAKVVRVAGADNEAAIIAARFLRLTLEDERKLSSLVMDYQRRECITKKIIG